MQAPENLTQISGEIVTRKPNLSLDGYDIVTVRVKNAGAVEGKPQILNPLPGDVIDLVVRRELLGSAAAGTPIRCRAKHSVNGPMCEPHPEAGDFSLS